MNIKKLLECMYCCLLCNEFATRFVTVLWLSTLRNNQYLFLATFEYPSHFSPRHIKRYLTQLAQAKSVCERRIMELDGNSAVGGSVSRDGTCGIPAILGFPLQCR